MTGAYVTADGGASWRMINFGSVPTAFAFDPSRPQTLYAGAEAVYKSDDAGRTWRMVLPDPAKNTVAKAIGDHGDRVVFTDDPAYPGSGRSVTIHAIAVDEDDPARVWVAASAADSPVPGTPASPTLLLGSSDGGRTWSRVKSLGSERVFALRAHGGGKAPRVERARRDRRLRRVRAVPAARPGSRRRPLHLRELRPRPALGRRVRLRHAAARHGAGRDRQAACRCPRTAAAPGAQRTAPCSRPRAWTTQATSGGPPRARARRSDRSPSPPAFRSSLTSACGASCSPAAATSPSTGSRRRRTADGAGASCTRSRTSRRPNLSGSWIEPRAAEDGHSVWFDSPYDLAVAPNDPDVAYATDLFRSYRTVGRREGVGPGQLRGPGRRPLDDARSRRHHDLRRAVRPVRRAHDVHPLHRHRPLPQRRRRRDVDGLLDGHPDAVAQHDVLARLRPGGAGPRLGRLQRDPRPAAAEDVAAHRPRALSRRRGRVDGRRPTLDGVEPGHAGVGDHARPRRPEEPEGQPHALRDGFRSRRLQVHRQRANLGAPEQRPGSRPAESALRLAADARARTARSTSSSRAAASVGG